MSHIGTDPPASASASPKARLTVFDVALPRLPAPVVLVRREPGEGNLAERFARGEISSQEFRERLGALR